MGVTAGVNIVTDGLVLAFDAGADANFGYTISTNKYGNTTTFLGGVGSSYEADSNPTNEIILLENPSNYSPYVLRQNGNLTEYQINLSTELVSNTTYVLSGWYAKSSDYNGSDMMFHCRAFSTSGNHVALGTGIGTVAKTEVVNGITWSFCYTTITTPSDYSNTFNWYLGYGQTTHNGYRYYADIRLEEGTFPTQKNLKSSSNNAKAVNGVTYSISNGGSLTFDGTNDYIVISSPGSYANYTFMFFCKWIAETQNSNRLFGLDNFGTYTVLNQTNVGFHYNPAGGSPPSTTVSSGVNVGFGNWCHVAVSVDATNSLVTIYVNGISRNTTSSIPSQNFAGNIYLGAQNTISSVIANCNIANFYLYNKVLSASEVLQNFNAQRDRFGI